MDKTAFVANIVPKPIVGVEDAQYGIDFKTPDKKEFKTTRNQIN